MHWQTVRDQDNTMRLAIPGLLIMSRRIRGWWKRFRSKDKEGGRGSNGIMLEQATLSNVHMIVHAGRMESCKAANRQGWQGVGGAAADHKQNLVPEPTVYPF